MRHIKDLIVRKESKTLKWVHIQDFFLLVKIYVENTNIKQLWLKALQKYKIILFYSMRFEYDNDI